jgi:hypothetical protein
VSKGIRLAARRDDELGGQEVVEVTLERNGGHIGSEEYKSGMRQSQPADQRSVNHVTQNVCQPVCVSHGGMLI